MTDLVYNARPATALVEVFLSPGADAIRILTCEADVKPDIAGFDPAKFAKALLERRRLCSTAQ
jgi:hypothetical protein